MGNSFNYYTAKSDISESNDFEDVQQNLDTVTVQDHDPAHVPNDPVQPSVHTINDPVHTSNDPVHTSNDPVHTINDPVYTSNDPVHTSNDPVHTSNDPVQDSVQDPAHEQFYYSEQLLDTVINAVNNNFQAVENGFKDALDKLNSMCSVVQSDDSRTDSSTDSDMPDLIDFTEQGSAPVSDNMERSISFVGIKSELRNKFLEKTISGRKYGFLRDPNPPVAEVFGEDFVAEETSVDMSVDFPVIYDQGHLGSCTSNAIAGAFDYYLFRKNNERFDASRMFIYFNEREIEGHINTDSGAIIKDGMDSIKIKGACSESDWPYDIEKFAVRPSQKAYTDAVTHRCSDYSPINVSSRDFKIALNHGYPVVFGFNVYSSFESIDMAKTGIMKMPGPFERLLGGHAVVAVGYDDDFEHNGTKGYFLIRNSWGSEWGMNGHFRMPYDFVDKHDECADSWIIGGYKGYDDSDNDTEYTEELIDETEEFVENEIDDVD